MANLNGPVRVSAVALLAGAVAGSVDDFGIYWANSNTGYFGVPILAMHNP